MLSDRRQRVIAFWLIFFTIWDLALAAGATVFPDVWFRLFHGVPLDDPQALLRRAGAVWFAFAVFHFIAWRRWKTGAHWLIIVGGMRLGELFADYTYLFLANDLTTFGTLALLGATPVNLFFGWFFISNALRVQYGLKYFGPVEYHALRSLVDVLVSGGEEQVTPREAALGVDGYLASFRAQRKFIAKVALLGIEFYPLLTFKPPFSRMDHARRREFIENRFRREVERRRIRGVFRQVVQAMIRFGQQLSFLGYYSHPKSFASVGYTPFSRRDRFAEAARGTKPAPSLAVTTPAQIGSSRRKNADVVIIGSGAAGAILAHELVAKGRDVVIVERGRHVPRAEFTEDEVASISRLYDEGALQLSQNFRLQVLQGSCVGGTTVVNNAVCFDPPKNVVARWNDPNGHDAGISEAGLYDAVQYVRTRLGIAFQDTTGSVLNPGDTYFERGLRALGLSGVRYNAVEANIGKCVGCGYCNIGCKYGTKLDMQETFLPWTQSAGGGGHLEIVSECKVTRLRHKSTRVTGLDCKLSTGQRLRIEANTVVLAAGAISSPFLLLKSGIALGRVGKGVSFNVGSPITAKLPERVNAFDALQISHFLELDPHPGYVIETWFNPPVAQALAMPGWFRDHFENMLEYPYMNAAAPLVGTESNGTVGVDLFGGLTIDFQPSAKDFEYIRSGLKQIARIFLAGGAERVMPSTFKYMALTGESDVSRIDDEIRDSGDVTIGTGHPQGGNAISKQREQGVVTPEFKVWDFENLYCCDASVFPTSTGVNPQLTVMALAKYGAQFVT